MAITSKGHNWNGSVKEVAGMENGAVFPFGSECIIYRQSRASASGLVPEVLHNASENKLGMGPNKPSAIEAGIMAAIAEVRNETKDIVWKRK